jgi:predicted transcriptional regulator
MECNSRGAVRSSVFQSFLSRLFTNEKTGRQHALGELECAVLEHVWTLNEATVHDVVARMERPLAYTTIMTTLDRLYRKGLLVRLKRGRAFVYTAACTKQDVQREIARELVNEISADPLHSRSYLLSFLIDSVDPQDAEVLTKLEAAIRDKRRQAKREDKE